MPSTREVMETTIALEKETMRLYARFARAFAGDARLHEFWFAMARDEAQHVGALELVSTVLGFEGTLDQPSPVSFESSTVQRLRGLLQTYGSDQAAQLPIDRALGIAVDIEETELEDLVGDLLKVALQGGGEYERYLRLLVHDMGDLSYMVEQYTRDPELLRRCDQMVDRHAEALRHSAGR